MKKLLIMAALMWTASQMWAADQVTITVKNSLNTPRSGEMAEVDVAQVKAKLGEGTAFKVVDSDGKEVPSQLTYDGKLIFPIGVAGKGKSVYYAVKGQPSTYETLVFGRQFPERVDDMAWENDRVAFRCYGPALQRNGERAWGYDVWNKRTSKLVVESRYANELDAEMSRAINKLRQMGRGDVADDVYNAISYHVDHGNGMDCYKVGPTLGCGTAALMADGKIMYPRCYKSYEILDKGPLRFTVKLVYGTEQINGMNVVETRIISLDAGSHLNRVTVSYEGLNQLMPLAVGIVIHNENPNAYVLNPDNGYMGYEDLGDPNQYKEKYRATQNKDFGHIYVGTIVPYKKTGKKKSVNQVGDMKFKGETGLPGATGHILTFTSIGNNEPLTYYFGSGWDRNTETSFHSLSDWEAYLSQYALQANSPLEIKLK